MENVVRVARGEPSSAGRPDDYDKLQRKYSAARKSAHQRWKGMRVCKNCGKLKHRRPRGLCHSCFVDPNIRALYPREDGKGLGKENIANPDCGEPTESRPGDPVRITAYEDRVRRGLAVFNPRDGMRLKTKEVEMAIAREIDTAPSWIRAYYRKRYWRLRLLIAEAQIRRYVASLFSVD